jgi:LytS/YehU family sensor histidine kinase
LSRERELRAARLEAALATAQLQALQAQLHPHFLFNTLNAIASLIPEDAAAAEEMVEALSELLRAALQDGGAREIPLRRELDLADQYVRIQQLRFHDRLRVHRDVDPDTLDALVPPLLLQPLVENAIRHGIGSRPEGGIVTLRAHRENGWLLLAVEDDGRGLPAGTAVASGNGVGLTNARARLERLHGTSAQLELANGASRGTTVHVRLPLRRSSNAAPHDGAAW